MFTNLKMYFKEKNIDISDTMSEIKHAKKVASQMGDNADDKHIVKASWQLATLIFTAFYLDHSQNDYLSLYFSQKLQTNINKLMLSLEIVQSVLSKSELLANEDDESGDWGDDPDQNDSTEFGKPFNEMDDILNADTSDWDPFRDAHKFEALAAAEQ